MQQIIEFITESNLAIPIRIVLILSITKVIAQLAKRAYNKNKPEKDVLIKHFIFDVIIAIIYIIGVMTAIGQIPQLNSTFKTLLAGSGIIALAISFSAQESLSNIISGIFIILFNPFEIGDRITLVNSNLTGTIEDITLRHTVIKTFINSRVVIPNSIISKEIIENSNLIDSKASSFIDVYIAYEADIDKAIEILEDIIGNNQYYIDTRSEEEKENTPKVKVYIRELGDSGVGLRASMWTKTVNDNFNACSEVRYLILKKFKENNIEIPYNKIHIVSDKG